MQRVYITSCSSRFCDQALDTKNYRDPSSSWSQDFLSSWQTWNRNSHFLYIWRQHQCFGGHMRRLEPACGWVTIQGSKTFSRKPWRSRLWKYARNSCITTDYSIENSMQFIWWPHSYTWKKVGRHYWQWVQPPTWVAIPCLKICWKIGTSRKSPWQRSRWSNSLEMDTSEAEIYVHEARRRHVHW